jgi:rhamnose utilization protein RhaD (predicted bifunctional aldolase and dehydrogenase)
MSSSPSLQSLVALSSRIGRNLNLVQAGGGNTSLKENGTLWVKASGKWLARASEEDMFLPVPMADIASNMAAGRESFAEYRTPSGTVLRPSVETTMHAVLPHRVVVHVHSVAAIAWSARADGPDSIRSPLEGLRWAWISYVHPGLTLAKRIEEELPDKPDVLLLGNHGLVVAGKDCDAAEKLLHDVEHRLAVDAQPAPAADKQALERLTRRTQWLLAQDDEVHALATNARSCKIAAGGTMYPDHCVYLGPAAATVRSGESIDQAVERYMTRYNYRPSVLLVEGKGVITTKDLNRAGRELLLCLKRVVECIPADVSPTYLEDWQVAKLMNWDAEKYRISLAQGQR